MPTFRTAPSANLTDSIRRLIASGGGGVSPLDEAQVDSMAANTVRNMTLAEKARAEVEAMQRAEARRTDPALRTEYAAHASGIDLPDATRLSGAIRGQLEQPSAADMGDANAVGAEARPFPMARPNLQPGQERLFRAALASVHGLDFATGNTNAEQLAKAGGEHQQNALVEAVQQAVARGDYQGASAVSQGSKPGTPIKLYDNVGSTGATFAPATGDVFSDPKADPGNTLLARTVATATAEEQQRRAAAGASNAAASASTAHAGLYNAQASAERTGGTQGKAPPGYRWGPPDAQGNPTLVPIEGGPATIKATSSDAERIAAGYASRMLASAKIMGELEASGVGKPEAGETAAGALPGGAGKIASNAAMSAERQKFRQAQEDWVRAKLRKESGAVIADEEMDREIRTYFPQIGDKPGTVKQKAHSRATAEQAMVQAAGRAHVAQGQQPAAAGNVEAEKMIGNVRFVKVGGKWYTP